MKNIKDEIFLTLSRNVITEVYGQVRINISESVHDTTHFLLRDDHYNITILNSLTNKIPMDKIAYIKDRLKGV